MQEFFGRIGNSYLGSIVHFFSSNEDPSRAEFAGFVSYLDHRPFADYWGWIPALSAGEADAFDIYSDRRGGRGESMWELDEAGERRAVRARDQHLPLLYLHPDTGANNEEGFDHASDPQRLAAIMQARKTDLPEATEPIAPAGADSSEPVMLVYRRVMRAHGDALLGFVVVALRPHELLAHSWIRETATAEAISESALCVPDESGALRVIATSRGGPPVGSRISAADRNPDWLVAPIFAFGRVFSIVSIPAYSAPWNSANAIRRTAVSGFLLTGLLVALVATLAGRRAMLQRIVGERTKELRASVDSYRGLFNSIRQAIYIQDKHGVFLDVNDGAVEMYGYPRAEFIGRTPEFLSPPGRNDLSLVMQYIQRAWSGVPQTFEFWGLRKSGEIFPKTVSLYKGLYFGRDVLIAVGSDITEQKRAEAQQTQLQTQLQQAQKLESIGRLAGGIAHDFNNMLQAILGNAMLAMEETPPGRSREYLSEIKRSAERSAELTRQLLAFASRQPVNPKSIDLNETISGMLKMLRRLIGEDILLRWNPGSDLWPVRMDPVQVDQILANLAVNARDAIDGVGCITIETWNLAADDENARSALQGCPPGDLTCMRVADTGHGMDAQTLSQIFEPFFTTKPEGRGVGLGLATVFGIVKQNEGTIHVQSAPGQGASFTICIPRTHQTPAREAQNGAAERATGGHETLLIVEDEGSVLLVCENALKQMGYKVLARNRPERAIDLVRNYDGPIHLLLTDVVMPGMNGREMAQFISAMRPTIKVLFMSGYTADIIETRGVLDEGVYFIQKPFRAAQLAEKIRAVLDAPPVG